MSETISTDEALSRVADAFQNTSTETARRAFPIRAMPGRIILRFPPPAEESRGGIIIPETSAQRVEVAEIYDVGDVLRDEQFPLRDYLLLLQAAGKRILVTFGSGVGFWHNDDKKADLGAWEWIKDFRSYRMEEPSAFLEPE